jgi:hypothetical protein
MAMQLLVAVILSFGETDVPALVEFIEEPDVSPKKKPSM